MTTSLTFWQYFKLTKQTSLYCLKICSILFSVIAMILYLAIEWDKNNEDNPIVILIICELFGLGLAMFILFVAMVEGYVKSKVVLNRFSRIPDDVKKHYALELVQKPLNPKYYYLDFQIVHQLDGEYYELDEQLKKEIIRFWES